MSRTRTRKSRVLDQIRETARTRPWWHTALLVLGLVTLLTAVSVLFFGINNAPSRIVTSDAVAAVDSTEFAEALSGVAGAPMERGGTVQVLNNGDEFLPALLQSIEHARHSINFSVYIWEDGAFSDRVLDGLIRKQRQGVAVRVLLDGLGGRNAPDARFDELKRLGGHVERFRTPKFGTWTRFHRRNHRRAIVIDGNVGFTGGIAVGDQWLGHAQDPDHWRDLMFKLTGPLASSLQGAFVDEWAGSAGEILVGPKTYPAREAVAPGAGIERFLHHINSPADDDHSMAYFFLLSILAARDTVHIRTPYFIPDDPLMRVLTDKARGGVDVRLLLPGPNIDNRTVRFSGQDRYDELMQAGVRVYEYQPTFTHAKAAVVDGRWSIIGSANLDSRSRQLDEENVFGILDADLAAKLETLFAADLARSKEIKIDEWRRRNPFIRLLQVASRILDQQS